MKILHLEASPGWGGQEIRILRESEGMRARGHQVVMGVMRGGGLIEPACKAGFTVVPLNFNKSHWFPCLYQILALIRFHQIDLINTHSSLDAWIGGVAGRIAGKPIVRTRHLSTPIKPGLNSKLLYGRFADLIVTTCSSILPMICSQSGKRETDCQSIPTGVDPDKIRVKEGEAAKIRADLGVGPEEFLVGTACFMRSWKGIPDFLKAADILRGLRDIKWVIIGGGHDQTYRQMAKEMKLEGRVHFTGHLENPFPALAALDLFALLSTAHEGVSQAILQAAYLGKPLVSTPVGGLGEVCRDRISGIQVPPFSPDKTARAVLELKEQNALRETFGRNAKNLVMENFTLAQTIDQMESVYARAVCRRASH